MEMNGPNVLYPTLVKGRIDGPIRCESVDGSELWLPNYGDCELHIEPFEKNGKMWCVSHLQKKAKYFSLRFDPFIYHWGKFWHRQEFTEEPDGVIHWKPGTERGIYWRTPGWRWNIPDKNSDMTPWIFSKGFFGGHLD
jgi:hypothetical protein